MNLELSDEEAAALIKELADITRNDRYPFSPRIQTLRAILGKPKPEPVREPLPPAEGLCAAASNNRQEKENRQCRSALFVMVPRSTRSRNY
jgi:hypothetical protein